MAHPLLWHARWIACPVQSRAGHASCCALWFIGGIATIRIPQTRPNDSLPPVVWTSGTREDQLDLVARAQKGDRDAFDRLIDLYAADLYRLALAVAGPEAARDVTQDALLTAWRELPSLRDPDRFLPWLRRILVNRARDLARRDRRPGHSPFSLDRLAAGGSSPGLPRTVDPAAGLDRQTDLHRALAKLSVDQRAVVGLHYLADLSLPEVAATLGIPLGTAKSRLGAALVVLRRHLREPA